MRAAGEWHFSFPVFAFVAQRKTGQVLELTWFGELGDVDPGWLRDAELGPRGEPLRREVRVVALTQAAHSMPVNSITPHALRQSLTCSRALQRLQVGAADDPDT